jgi:hypothetical protein
MYILCMPPLTIDLGPLKQFLIIGCEKIRIQILCELPAGLFINVAKAEPPDPRIISGKRSADTPDLATPHYGQADGTILRIHLLLLQDGCPFGIR